MNNGKSGKNYKFGGLGETLKNIIFHLWHAMVDRFKVRIIERWKNGLNSDENINFTNRKVGLTDLFRLAEENNTSIEKVCGNLLRDNQKVSNEVAILLDSVDFLYNEYYNNKEPEARDFMIDSTLTALSRFRIKEKEYFLTIEQKEEGHPLFGGLWFPGGFIEGKTPYQTFEAETREETGVDIKKVGGEFRLEDSVIAYETHKKYGDKVIFQVYALYDACVDELPKASADNEETRKAEWKEVPLDGEFLENTLTRMPGKIRGLLGIEEKYRDVPYVKGVIDLKRKIESLEPPK